MASPTQAETAVGAEASTPAFEPPTYVGVDLSIRAAKSPTSYGLRTSQYARLYQYLPKATSRARAVVAVCNLTYRARHVQLRGTASGQVFKVRYVAPGGANVTAQVVAGTYRTPKLATNECTRLSLLIWPAHAPKPRDRRAFNVWTIPSAKNLTPDKVGDVVVGHPPIVLGNDTVTPTTA